MKRRHRSWHEGEGRQPTLNAVMTHDEVAKRLGVCRQAVVRLEARALQKLRKSRVLRELFR
jgi:DNA-directed RNA polymerase sigma subunit (sigma70/sigma32)